MIEIKNVTKKFGDFTAIENISMQIEESSIYGLVGYNGAGKTTLLKICTGIYKPENGEVLIDGENVYDNGKSETIFSLSRMSFIFREVPRLVRCGIFIKGTMKIFQTRFSIK